MYEKRKYGSRVRYRITDSLSKSEADNIATNVRYYYKEGANVDTYKGKYAVWCDAKIKIVNSVAVGYEAKKHVHSPSKAPKHKRSSRPAKYGSLDLPELGEGFEAIDMKDYSSGNIVAVRQTRGKDTYRIAKTGTKDSIVKAAKSELKKGFTVAVVRFSDTWALAELEGEGLKPKKQTQYPKRGRGEIRHSGGVTYNPNPLAVKRTIVVKPVKKSERKTGTHPAGQYTYLMINIEGTSNKFWGIYEGTNDVEVRWGSLKANKYGYQNLVFSSEEARLDFVEKMVLQKKSKGYRVVSGSRYTDALKMAGL